MEPDGYWQRLRDNLARLSANPSRSPEESKILEEVNQDLERLQVRLSWLGRGQRSIDERLEKIEQSLFFRILRWPGVRYAQIRNLMDRWLPRSDSKYSEWVAYEQRSLFASREECIERIARFVYKPLITVALVVRDARADWLLEAIESVRAQIYCLWELCICIDGSAEPALLARIDALSASGVAVRIVCHDSPEGFPAGLNAACSMARGEYLGFLGQDDILSPHALFYVAEALQSQEAAILYSDEDKLSVDGRRIEPLFKPAWSPDLLLSKMYMAYFLVTSTEAFRAAGGFRVDCTGAEDLDLCLRITEMSERVTHIPRILYHRRKRNEDVDSGAAIAKVLQEAIRRREWDAEVVNRPNSITFQIRHATKRRVSLIICSRSPKLLRSALKSVRSSTSYPDYEIIVAEHCPNGENPEMARLASEYGCGRVAVGGPFNFAHLNNLASKDAPGDVLVFLNDDVEPLRPDWLAALVSHLELEQVGVVGGKLLYPTGAIQHAGVAVGIGDGAGHVNRYMYKGVYWTWVDETRNVSAVTGACLAIRAQLFRRLGGFDVLFPNNYNDVDLCLRAQEAGYRVVYEPAALLRHYEGQTRKLYVGYMEREKFYARWHRVVDQSDRFYTPNLTVGGEDASLRLTVDQSGLGGRKALLRSGK